MVTEVVLTELSFTMPKSAVVTPPTPTETIVDKIKAWWDSLSTLQKIGLIAGVSGSTIAVIALSRVKRR